MPESFARAHFPSLYGKLERKKQTARNEPLSILEINTLLSMRFNNKPLFPSVEFFYSEEFQLAIKNGAPSAELDKLQRFRKPTEEELNLLFNDIHFREEKEQYTGSNQSGD